MSKVLGLAALRLTATLTPDMPRWKNKECGLLQMEGKHGNVAYVLTCINKVCLNHVLKSTARPGVLPTLCVAECNPTNIGHPDIIRHTYCI